MILEQLMLMLLQIHILKIPFLTLQSISNFFLKLCIQFTILNLVGRIDVVNYKRHHFEFSSCRETMSPIIVSAVVFLFTLIKRTHYLFSITL